MCCCAAESHSGSVSMRSSGCVPLLPVCIILDFQIGICMFLHMCTHAFVCMCVCSFMHSCASTGCLCTCMSDVSMVRSEKKRDREVGIRNVSGKGDNIKKKSSCQGGSDIENERQRNSLWGDAHGDQRHILPP